MSKCCPARACTLLALIARCSGTAPELTFAAEHHASAGVYALSIGTKSFTASGDYGITTRGFVGTTFRMKPGESLRIDLTNDMTAANNRACTQTAGEFCESTITNFHTHGLHISSKGVVDGLTYESDNIFATVAPGGATQGFEFTIPDYHMGGTHWYHPHHHHATALQAGGGAAGVLIVDDPDGYLPAEYSAMTEKVMFISGHNLQTLQAIAMSAGVTNWFETAVADANAAGLGTNVFLVNGQMGPTITMPSHSWHRLRMVYAAVEQTLDLSIGADSTATCTMELIAKDGVYLQEIPRAVTTIYLYPGSRADVAMSCTCATYPCEATLTSAPVARRLQARGRRQGRRAQGKPKPGAAAKPAPAKPGMEVADVTVLTITVTETVGGTTPTLPIVQLPRPCYLADLQSATVPPGNQGGTLALNGGQRRVTWNNQGDSMTYAAVHANDKTMADWPPITTFATGTVYEWTVTGANAHPYHVHVNPYQIMSMGGETSVNDGYFQAGDWHDTLFIEGANNIVVRMNTDKFTGKMVTHCHILEHEDEGMMAYINVVGTEGAVYTEATTLEPTCYSSAYGSTGQGSATTTTTTLGSVTVLMEVENMDFDQLMENPEVMEEVEEAVQDGVAEAVAPPGRPPRPERVRVRMFRASVMAEATVVFEDAEERDAATAIVNDDFDNITSTCMRKMKGVRNVDKCMSGQMGMRKRPKRHFNGRPKPGKKGSPGEWKSKPKKDKRTDEGEESASGSWRAHGVPVLAGISALVLLLLSE